MKTIEEKAKAYDEALERAKNCFKDDTITNTAKSYVKDIFPELAESEDEKIRKDVKRAISVAFDYSYFDKETANNCLAWLEKQGKTMPEDIKEEKIDNGNKVEAKFKVGDWVVTSYGKVNQVIAVDGDGDGFTLDDDTYFSDSWKDSYHLWTIQDAKDGDVLYSLDSNQPFIYKERNVYEQAIAYCGLNIYGKFFVWGTKDCVITLSNYVPATKEQRDLLFSKMNEAGYEWDSEKKELKLLITNGGDFESENCEQKSATWGEEDEETMSELLSFLLINTPEQWAKYGNWLKSLKERYTWKPSDGQLNALHDAAVYIDKSMFPYPKGILMGLYKQLKKL